MVFTIISRNEDRTDNDDTGGRRKAAATTTTTPTSSGSSRQNSRKSNMSSVEDLESIVSKLIEVKSVVHGRRK